MDRKRSRWGRLRSGTVCLALAWSLPGAWGQSLRVSPKTGAPGEWVTLEITFQSRPGPDLVAFQWEVEVPSGSLDLGDAPSTRVPLAVKEAGKSINCGVSKKTGERLLLPCILAGGQEPIPVGTLVLVSLKIGARAHPGNVPVRLQNAIALTSDLKQVPLEPAEGVLTIRAR